MKKLLVAILITLISFPIYAQNLDSSNYTLLAPSIETNNGIIESTNYSALVNSSSVDDFTSSSSNYSILGGTANFIEAAVPTILCFETSTTSVTTNCQGIPGGDGMRGICSSPGCYDRAKIEINTQQNPGDVKYAIQIATNSSFTSGVQYIAGSNRFPKPNLTINDFLYKCEWEGIIDGSYCVSTNTTYQKYNILGLTPGTLYYLRAAALKEINNNGTFTQSEWSPAVTAATENPSLSFDIDIAANTSTSTNPPYILSVNNIIPESTFTSSNNIIIKTTTNALNGINTYVRSNNGNLTHVSTGDTIPTYSGDLDLVSNGFGLRNDSATNGQTNSGYLGSINVNTSPIDYSDSGAVNKVGGVSTTFTELLNSNSLPLLNGVSGFKLKAKTDFSRSAGQYNETLTIIPFGIY
mgnify:CR=1 FL=1